MNKFVYVKDNMLSKKDCDNIIKTCDKNLSPSLDYQGYEYYDIKSNKGYGSKRHMEGIKKYGISPWHRKSFGICATSKINENFK